MPTESVFRDSADLGRLQGERAPLAKGCRGISVTGVWKTRLLDELKYLIFDINSPQLILDTLKKKSLGDPYV